jgi:CDP-glucose 4,6-dehydratase
MHFLITGHTGFKGSWLSVMLKLQGHKVSGLSLAPVPESLFNQARLKDLFDADLRIDISKEIDHDFTNSKPDVLIHLAAQPLVKESYKDPILTFKTNVIGTLNVLEITKQLSLLSTLIITTDKVYQINVENNGYVESDPLGGNDPYSASKAAADLATQSWRNSFSNHPIGIARAGNVIGGGDFAQNRLLPNLMESYLNDRSPILRFPNSIRPWQHVLDCLNGYLKLIEFQIQESIASEWNFGPRNSEVHTVKEVAEKVGSFWPGSKKWEIDDSVHEKETDILTLNSEKARTLLEWEEKLDFHNSIDWASQFYFDMHSGKDPRKLLEKQIDNYLNL